MLVEVFLAHSQVAGYVPGYRTEMEQDTFFMYTCTNGTRWSLAVHSSFATLLGTYVGYKASYLGLLILQT